MCAAGACVQVCSCMRLDWYSLDKILRCVTQINNDFKH